MIHDLRMAELLCTRLCHDLTGPIGAVHNGAEFLSEEGFNLQGQAVELIVSSAQSAVARLQFYRVAYGRVKDQGEAPLAERQKMAADFFADSKITLDWPDSHTDASGVSISLKMLRLLYNLLIIASGTLIRGGTIAVRLSVGEDGNNHLTVSAQGTAIKWEPETQDILDGRLGTEHADAKNIQCFLTRILANELNATMSVNVGENEVAISVIKPKSLPETVEHNTHEEV